ncbi:MAG: PstC family ABC transporter permease, partial [Prochloraceae cyanobacterium]
YGVGATRWETIIRIILPAASSGIIGGVMLALGRALGETMAVTMLIGNANRIYHSLFEPSNTIASLIANQFAEATELQKSSLMYAGLILFAITLLVNIAAQSLVTRLQKI